MQMLCKVAADLSDVRCPVCGQAFMVYWTRSREISRAEQRQSLGEALRGQHVTSDAGDIHAPAFQLPDTPLALPRRIPQPAPPAAPIGAIPVYH